jgi:hypothetical protein
VIGGLYLDPGDRHARVARLLHVPAGRGPPRLCRVLSGWGPGGGPRNVLIEYKDDGSQAVIPFPRRLRRHPPAGRAGAGT